MFNAFSFEQEQHSVIKVKHVGIKQKEAKEMSVRPHSSQFQPQTSPGCRVWCLKSSPSDPAKDLLSHLCQMKGHEKNKGKILNSSFGYLPSATIKYGSISSVLPITRHTSVAGQSILETAYPTCWHTTAMRWWMFLRHESSDKYRLESWCLSQEISRDSITAAQSRHSEKGLAVWLLGRNCLKASSEVICNTCLMQTWAVGLAWRTSTCPLLHRTVGQQQQQHFPLPACSLPHKWGTVPFYQISLFVHVFNWIKQLHEVLRHMVYY